MTTIRIADTVVPYGEPQTWYFTFGFGQEHAGRYVKLTGLTGDEARLRMFELFERRWGFQYDEADWHKDGVSQAEKYGLTELDVERTGSGVGSRGADSA